MTGFVRQMRPIYGNGWVNADGAPRDVPAPFRIGYDALGSLGGVVLEDHEFVGATAHLSPRHTTEDGIFNVEISRGAMLLSRGYAEA